VRISLFTNKSAHRLYEYFRDLEMVRDFTWGRANLVHMYREVNVAGVHKIRNLDGYMTLHLA